MSSKGKELKIGISEEQFKAVHANYFRVTHYEQEFIFDFGTVLEGRGVFTARIFVFPGLAKSIAKALNENLAEYEKKFGEIKQLKEPPPEIGFV